jgi:hypothetical protein
VKRSSGAKGQERREGYRKSADQRTDQEDLEVRLARVKHEEGVSKPMKTLLAGPSISGVLANHINGSPGGGDAARAALTAACKL